MNTLEHDIRFSPRVNTFDFEAVYNCNKIERQTKQNLLLLLQLQNDTG